MWKRTGRVFLAAAAAALTTSLGTAQALAAPSPFPPPPPWTVHPGGSFTAALSGTWTLKDTAPGRSSITCTTGSLAGTANSSNTDTIGSITGSPLGGCADPASLSFTVTAKLLPWTLIATSYAAPLVAGNFAGVKFKLSRTGCTALVEAAPVTSGEVKYKYSNSDHYLKIALASTNLKFQAVTGCAGLFASNDPAEIAATYGPMSPANKILP
jgi:hypothetical protein